MNDVARRPVIAALVLLLVSLAGLLAAFLLSLGTAARYFDRAAAAQAQLAAVSRIEALAARPHTKGPLTAALDAYRASIAREARLLDSPAETAKQVEEMVAAHHLARLAFAPDRRPRFEALISRIAEQERRETAEVGAAMGRLRFRTTLLASLLALSAFGATLAGIGACWSANRRLAREVEARTAELREVDQSRRLFFAKASHELRTPITVMRGEAEVALSDPHADGDDLRESLRHVVANAAFLGRRVDELLGLSKAADGRILLMRDATDLAALLHSTVEAVEGYARSVDVRVDLDRPEGRLRTMADSRWLGQALLAVVDNAVKFSPIAGVVRLVVALDGGRVRIAVIDNGPGIVAEALPRIFDAYYQTEAGRMRGGTGLGLALARWVVEQHGGRIAAANEPGGGCRITITLPMERETLIGARVMEDAA